MGNYDSIQVPVGNNVISAAQYGVKVRDAILSLDARVSSIESTLSNYTFKTAATTRASTVTIADDPDLKLYLEANSRYFVEFFIMGAAITLADIKTAWSAPVGYSGARRVLGPGTTSTTSTLADNAVVRIGAHNIETEIPYNGIRDANNTYFQIQEVGLILVGSTAGYLNFRWAQNSTQATGSVVGADSFGRATKVA